ncbi:MAG: hypothetical protein M1812_001462 [Candelaria pacifica]|nr:MAG: hypothetical protein M1812_001462 [Candelaria pacifica]
MDSKSVKSILTSNGPASPVLPPPVERIGPLSPDRTSPLRSPTRSKYPPSQTTSQAGTPRGNRLSLSFPIQPAINGYYNRYTPPSSTSTTPSLATMNEKPVPSPTEAGGFLTALAAQERRVLELKEELQRAEGDLEKLKKQWAMHETTRKKAEVNHVQQLQPLNTSPSLLDGNLDKSTEFIRRSQDLERRKTMLSESRPPVKKVFSGRHTKTLSLLADNPAIRQPLSQRADLQRRSTDKVRQEGVPRSTTLPDLGSEDLSVLEESLPHTVRHSLQGPAQKDALLQTGRQMASDFREGLWTFLDDIRQVTVGEEGVNGTDAKPGLTAGTPKGTERQGSVTSSKGSRKKNLGRPAPNNKSPYPTSPTKGSDQKSTFAGVDRSFWQENGLGGEEFLATPKQKNFTAKVQTPANHNDEDDSWETWDSPDGKSKSTKSNPESTSSASEGVPSPSVNGSTPRTSTSSTDVTPQQIKPLSPLYKGDEIPWPSLTKLSPGHLKRTASSFMLEWEKNLTPPNVSRSPSPDKGRKDD